MSRVEINPKVGTFFTHANLRTEWSCACTAGSLAKLEINQAKDE
jgi:hypothetical protein